MLIAKDVGKRAYDVLATWEWGRVPQPTTKLVERWARVYGGIYSHTSGFGGSIEGCRCSLLAFLYNGQSGTNRSNCKGGFLSPFIHGVYLFGLIHSTRQLILQFFDGIKMIKSVFLARLINQIRFICRYQNRTQPFKVRSQNHSKRNSLQLTPSNFFELAINGLTRIRPWNDLELHF